MKLYKVDLIMDNALEVLTHVLVVAEDIEKAVMKSQDKYLGKYEVCCVVEIKEIDGYRINLQKIE